MSVFWDVIYDLNIWKISYIDIINFFGNKWIVVDMDTIHRCLLVTPKNDDMYVLLKQLKSSWKKIWMITDNTRKRIDMLGEQFEIWLFDIIIASSEIWSQKNEEEIFRVALTWVNVTDPSEALFIDNSMKNLIVPEKIWMHTFHHDDEKNDIWLLTQYLQKLWVL